MIGKALMRVIAIALLLTAAPAAAAAPAPSAPPAATPPAAASAKPKLICRSTEETGSLVRRKRQCFTQAEWDRIAESEQKGAGRLIDELRTRPAGGS